MALLLDSNLLLWWLEGNPRLSPALLARLQVEPDLWISIVSPWELWIKAASGKLAIPDDLEERLAVGRIGVLAPTLADAQLAASLPPLHRDPFDRMIVAQAINRKLSLVTGDRKLADYGVSVLLA